MDAARLAAQTDDPVLITGEAGAAALDLAAWIHHESKRSDGPFGVARIRNIPENLLESELFGHVRAGLIGVCCHHHGRLAPFDGGTVVLDGIESLPLRMQAILLRFLQDRVVIPVGDTRRFPCNVRFISTTTVDLRGEVKAGHFREDALARLGHHTFRLAPLHERREAIGTAAEHLRSVFLRRELRGLFSEGQGPSFSAEALAEATRRVWPGNLDELEEAVLVALGCAEPPQPIGQELLRPRAPREETQKRLERVLTSAMKVHASAAAAKGFLTRTEGKIVALKKARQRSWRYEERDPPPAPRAARLRRPDDRLLPAISCLLRLDLLAPEPRWPLLREQGYAHQIGLRWSLLPGLVAPRWRVARALPSPSQSPGRQHDGGQP